MSLLWSFEGRIGRAGFWLGVLCMILLAMAIGIVATFLGVPPITAASEPSQISPAFAAIFGIGSIAILYVQLAICVKRFHDRGKSGWWALIAFVPVIGSLWISLSSACFPAILALMPTGRPVLKGRSPP